MFNERDHLEMLIFEHKLTQLLLRPKFIWLIIFSGLILAFCDAIESPEIKAQKEAQYLIRRTYIRRRPSDFKDSLEEINQAISLAPQLPETYAERGNLYHEWSNFLLDAKTDIEARQTAKELGFNLNAAGKYRNQALRDYRKAREIFNIREQSERSYGINTLALGTEVDKAISCLKKREECYAHILFSQIR